MQKILLIKLKESELFEFQLGFFLWVYSLREQPLSSLLLAARDVSRNVPKGGGWLLSQATGFMSYDWWKATHKLKASRMRRSVSSPDETTRRELKIRRATENFLRTSRRFIWWWNTVSNGWYYLSNKMILEGDINYAQMNSFSSDFETLMKH